MPVRRPRKHAVHLEVTAFINVIVVLVPFLLSTAVFSHLAVVDMALPTQSSGPERIDTDNLLKLEVVLRSDALEVGDRIGGLIQRIPSTPQGYDLATLSTLLQDIKAKYPATRSASVLAQPDTSYDSLVQVMDTVRQARPPGATGKVPDIELFPDVSIGDAPTSASKK
ncbi:ExbD/TolR family protein [Roseateles cellulosilyticus]|uniref:Biopolymer transporter ExbD n=1 Tax=Pelomonas cellulosilytica TaxID=2906762 RepID=A0ABS8XQ11_9BURK|nr:biopolymer transporter ExbD [Pelomonas sp. P8]MCE4552931.1 biopolymer transporter ExbD [Pelomonas sp. P8]